MILKSSAYIVMTNSGQAACGRFEHETQAPRLSETGRQFRRIALAHGLWRRFGRRARQCGRVAEPHACAESEPGANAEPHPDAEPVARVNACTDADANARSESDAESDTSAHPNAGSHANSCT